MPITCVLLPMANKREEQNNKRERNVSLQGWQGHKKEKNGILKKRKRKTIEIKKRWKECWRKENSGKIDKNKK